MKKEYRWINDEGWKCCKSMRDRICDKCGGPILKDTYYLYHKQGRESWPDYWCMACCPPSVLDRLSLMQTALKLPWKSVPVLSDAHRETKTFRVAPSLAIVICGNSITNVYCGSPPQDVGLANNSLATFIKDAQSKRRKL